MIHVRLAGWSALWLAGRMLSYGAHPAVGDSCSFHMMMVPSLRLPTNQTSATCEYSYCVLFVLVTREDGLNVWR